MIFKYLILKTPVFFGFFAGGRGISFLSDSNSMYGNQTKAATTTTTTDLYYTISKICAEKLSTTTNHQHGWYHTFIDCDLKYQEVSYTLDNAAAPAEGYYYYNVLLFFCQSLESNQSFCIL